MAEAQFIPPQAPGGAVDSLISGAGAAQSFMERSQRMQIQQAQEDRARQIYEIGLPVARAQADANMATARSNLAGQQRLYEVQQNFANDKVAAMNEIIAAKKLPTYAEQTDALSAIAQKYSYFELLPEGKQFLDTVKNQQLQAHNDAVLDHHTKAQLDFEAAKHAAAMEEITAKGEQAIERDKAWGRGATPEERDLSRANEYEMEGDEASANALRASVAARTARRGPQSAMVTVENKIAELKRDPNADPAAIARLEAWASKNSSNTQKISEFQANEKIIQEAKARGDERTVRAYESRQQKLTHSSDLPDAYPGTPAPPAPPSFLQRTINQVREKVTGQPTSPAAEPAGTAPIEPTKEPTFPSNTATVTVEGKQYPMAQDGKGRRAYYKDGRWWPLK